MSRYLVILATANSYERQLTKSNPKSFHRYYLPPGKLTILGLPMLSEVEAFLAIIYSQDSPLR